MSKVHLVGKVQRSETDTFEMIQPLSMDTLREIFQISNYQDGASIKKFISLGGEISIAEQLKVSLEVLVSLLMRPV